MSKFYAGLQATARRLLSDKGQAVVFTRTTEGTFDPVTGTRTGTSTSTFEGVGILEDYNLQQAGQMRVMGVEVHHDDKKLTVSVDAAPSLSDLVTVGGTTYAIRNIKQTNPAGTPILYEIHLTR